MNRNNFRHYILRYSFICCRLAVDLVRELLLRCFSFLISLNRVFTAFILACMGLVRLWAVKIFIRLSFVLFLLIGVRGRGILRLCLRCLFLCVSRQFQKGLFSFLMTLLLIQKDRFDFEFEFV